MHFHRRAQCETGCLGKIVLKYQGAMAYETLGGISVDVAVILRLFRRCRWN